MVHIELTVTASVRALTFETGQDDLLMLWQKNQEMVFKHKKYSLNHPSLKMFKFKLMS